MLTVEGLAVARGGVPVLEGLSFTLSAGEALVLRGPNGSGKTTLLRTLAGLQPPLAGRIEMADEALAYGGHLDGVKGVMTVAENLAFWAAIYGGGGTRAAVAAFDLQGLEDRAAQNLSAGQRRRRGLARMRVTGRPIWALDEPTVSLDAASVALFAAAVEAHLATGGAAILATHIELGLTGRVLDVTPYRARVAAMPEGFDEAFLCRAGLGGSAPRACGAPPEIFSAR